jgi:hypothetical protein
VGQFERSVPVTSRLGDGPQEFRGDRLHPVGGRVERGRHAIDGLQRLNPGGGAAEFVCTAELGRGHQLDPGSLGDVGEHAGQLCMNRCQRFDGRLSAAAGENLGGAEFKSDGTDRMSTGAVGAPVRVA